MKEKFQKLPPALQKQILIRFGASVLSLLLLIIVALLYRDLYLCISFLLFGAVFGVAGGLLLFGLLPEDMFWLKESASRLNRRLSERKQKAYILQRSHTSSKYGFATG